MEYRKEDNIANQLLVEKVLRGDTNAFRSIMKNTEGLVAQIVLKMIPHSADRKDIAQDIYLKTFQNLGSFKYESKLSTWIAKIAYNTCLNYLEKKKLVLLDKYTDEESDSDVLETLNNTIDIFSNDTEKLIVRKELTEILRTEIDKLSSVYKTLITLYHNEELNYLEIAEITALPEGTVKNYLFRARKILRDSLLLTYKKEAL